MSMRTLRWLLATFFAALAYWMPSAPVDAWASSSCPRRTSSSSSYSASAFQSTTRQPRPIQQLAMSNSDAIDEITMQAEERMEKSVDSVKVALTGIRTGRATTSILDRVKVDYYGAPTPLNQLASLSVPSAQQLTVDAYDKSGSAVADIEKAIVQAELGLTPNNDGSGLLRINIPPLTEERRKELLKQCKALGEDGKVAIRNIRRDGVDGIKKLEKKGDVGEDEMKDGLDVMQKMTDRSVKEIDDIVSKKEKEVMTV